MQVLPVKFESVLRGDKLSFAPLILPVESDLATFRKLHGYARRQDAGLLAVLSNPPGQGKTTAVYAASVLLRELFGPVLSVPPSLSLALRDLPSWLLANLPALVQEKTTLVLIDGRESTDDEQGLRDVMAALNNLVRGRPDLLFVWPTTDSQWRDRLVNTARDFGSKSFCPDAGIFAVAGPAKDQWVEAVGLVLDQLGSNWDEFGINESTATLMLPDFDTLGDFITGINQIRSDQEEVAESTTGLPQVVFVVSSHSRVVGDVARLRNSSSYKIRTEEIINSSRQSEVGKFWKARGAKQRTNLAWVSSLLQAKLVALTPSTVAHAVGLEAPASSRVGEAIAGQSFRPSKSTGATAFRTTDFARFLKGEPVPELLTANKGKTSESTLAAYDAIQSLSRLQHRSINEALLRFVGPVSGSFDPDGVQYEVGLGGDAIADAVVALDNQRIHFEFHHVSGPNCSPNKIAEYIMKKLRVYATQYNLIDR